MYLNKGISDGWDGNKYIDTIHNTTLFSPGWDDLLNLLMEKELFINNNKSEENKNQILLPILINQKSVTSSKEV